MGYYNDLSLTNAHRDSDDDHYDRLDGIAVPIAPVTFVREIFPAFEHIGKRRKLIGFYAKERGELVTVPGGSIAALFGSYQEAEQYLDEQAYQTLVETADQLATVAATTH